MVANYRHYADTNVVAIKHAMEMDYRARRAVD